MSIAQIKTEEVTRWILLRSQANFTCPIGHFMTEHTGVTEMLQSVRTWENETTIVVTMPWIEPIALETAAYSDGAR